MNHSLKHPSRRITASLILLALCFSSPDLRQARANQSDEIVLAQGTAINVVTAQDVNSKDAKPNDPVNFTVAEDLTINGQAIVRKGTAAVGSVINAEKGGYLGKSGKLGVQVESAQTVDGQPLRLRAAKGKEGNDKTNSVMALSMISGFFLLKKGGDAKIAIKAADVVVDIPVQ
jgi:hypothetical protein